MTTKNQNVPYQPIATHPPTYWNSQHCDEEAARESLIRLIAETALIVGCAEDVIEADRRPPLMQGLYTLLHSVTTYSTPRAYP